MPRRWRDFLVVVVLPTGLALIAAGIAQKAGAEVTLMLTIALFGVLCAIVAPPIYVTLLVLAAPLPSVGGFLGVPTPVGLDPYTVLLIGGLLVLIQDPPRWPSRVALKLLGATFAVVFALYAIAWYRTYGVDGVSATDAALLIKPFLLSLCGVVVVALVPRRKLVSTVATALLIAQAIIGMSVLLQVLGIYESAWQVENLGRLGIKQFGGLLLDGNTVGALFAVFAVPTYLLLRETGRKDLGIMLLVATPALLLISLSRSAIVAFVASLLLLAVHGRHRLANVALVGGIACISIVWATAIQASAFAELKSGVAADRSSNAILSGRLDIWDQAQLFLAQGNNLLVGGGLDAFRKFAGHSSLENEFATHSAILFLLTTGGLVLLSAYALLTIAAWLVSSAAPPAVKAATRLAIVAFLVVGLANDATLLTRLGAWIWLLLAMGAYLAQDTAESNRSAMAETS